MTRLIRPLSQAAARKLYSLLDTEDPYDAWETGRDGPETFHDGLGLRVQFDGTGTIPCMTINGPDGEIEFRGLPEIRAVHGAMKHGYRLAEAFGDPIPYEVWKKLNV